MTRQSAKLGSLAMAALLLSCGAREPQGGRHLPDSPGASARIAQLPLPAAAVDGFVVTGNGSLRPVLPGAARAEVELPPRADGALHVRARSDLSIAIRVAGARPVTAAAAGGFLLYAGAVSGHDLLLRPQPSGVEDFVALGARPADERIQYSVTMTAVAGVRHVGQSVEFLDAGGAPRLRMAPPWLLDANQTVHWADVDVSGCSYDTDPAAPWGREPTAPGAARCQVTVSWSGDNITYPALLDPSWTTTDSLAVARKYPKAVLLTTGRVLLAGGDVGGATAESELYDPTSETWAATGSMNDARRYFTLTALDNGSALAVGGASGATTLKTAELFQGGSFTRVGSMQTARQFHAATRLSDGRVLVCGGLGTSTLASCETYDPGSQAFSTVKSMASSRRQYTLTALANGRALAAGGLAGAAIRDAEVYDSVTNNWSATPAMNHVRFDHGAALLADGRVLIAGGYDGSLLADAELYDPVANSWTSTGSMVTDHDAASLVTLTNGGALETGGCASSACTSGKPDAELFDPASATWIATKAMADPRVAHVGVLLGDGRVLVAGGTNAALLSSAELFSLGAVNDSCTSGVECVSGACTTGHCQSGSGGAGGAGGAGGSAGSAGTAGNAGAAGAAGSGGVSGTGGSAGADAGAGATSASPKAKARSFYGCSVGEGPDGSDWSALLAGILAAAMCGRRRRSR